MPTLAQVQQHNTADDCWVILNNQVLDLTGFEKEHPGKTAFVKYAGTDITEILTKIHGGKGHAPGAYEWAKKFVIGELE